MQRSQGVCGLASLKLKLAGAALLLLLVLGCATMASAQVNTATLSGTVSDPQGLPVKGAKVTVTNAGTGAQRTSITDDEGRYNLVGLPPGQYKMNVDGGANFTVYENASVVLTVGESATFDPRLEPQRHEANGHSIGGNCANRNTEDRGVTNSCAAADRQPANQWTKLHQFHVDKLADQPRRRSSIGAAPTSGLNVGGQRARSNMVSVDGADAVDNSVNGIRATVSQEAVQEFQLILSNYNAEYGRAMGGVVNIVTKGGSNDVHGNVFGFLRNKAFQARNSFSVEVDPVTGAVNPVKQAYTRVQAGATIGGPIVKDKTFYFFSYETTRRQERDSRTLARITSTSCRRRHRRSPASPYL